MILMEEVDRLRKRLPKIKEMIVITPLTGQAVEQTYEFMGDMLLVRKIFEKVKLADRGADRFPQIKRSIKCKSDNEMKRMGVKAFVDRFVHASYIFKNDVELHVINDRGESLIVSSEEFMSVLESLCMEERDIIIAMCEFFRLQIQETLEIYKEYASDDKFFKRYRPISNKIHTNFLDWMIGTYCNNEGLRQEILKSFFSSEYQNEKTFCFFYNRGSEFGDGYYRVGIGCKCKDQSDKYVYVDVENFLSVIKKYME